MKTHNDKHTVNYTSHDYHSMCQKSKERIKKMQAEGISTSHDPKDNPQDASKKEHGYSVFSFFS